MATLIMTAELNDCDPLAWSADALSRIAGTPQDRLSELLPWNCRTEALARRLWRRSREQRVEQLLRTLQPLVGQDN
jgi:IS66 C-terminal element